MADIYDEEMDLDEGTASKQEDVGDEAQQEKAASGEPAKEAVKQTGDAPKGVTLSETEYANFKRAEQDMVLANMEKELKKEYPDFKMSDVTDEILKIAESDPKRAQELFNRNGIEMVFLKSVRGRKVDDEPEFDTARGVGGGGINRSEMARRINKGEISQDEKLAYLSKIF